MSTPLNPRNSLCLLRDVSAIVVSLSGGGIRVDFRGFRPLLAGGFFAAGGGSFATRGDPVEVGGTVDGGGSGGADEGFGRDVVVRAATWTGAWTLLVNMA